jgi:hypothetical protein
MSRILIGWEVVTASDIFFHSNDYTMQCVESFTSQQLLYKRCTGNTKLGQFKITDSAIIQF